MIIRSFILSFALILGLITAPARAAIEIPALSSPVVDEVGLLSVGTKQRLEANLFEFSKSQQVQLQVYVIKSLQGDSIESVAIQVFDKWKLGDEKTDKGLLLLIAPNEKRMRIEVGQGLEGDLPDVIAKRIISDVVRPYFARSEFDMGVAQGVATIQNYIVNTDPSHKASVQEEAQQPRKKGSALIFFIIAGIWLIIFMFNPSLALYILFSALRGGGGGGGGGSWSGGGGRSSGGGASGGW